jgi:carbon monoxide dehydrogenase subunit G
LAAYLKDAGAAPAAEEWEIKVLREGGELIVDATLYAPVTPREAWAVLTDFERMAQWVPNLQSSQVLSKPGEMPLRVAQKGAGRVGPFRAPFESVREVELIPEHTMRSKNVAGNMRRMESTTRLFADPSGTRIDYHLEVAPDYWVPPLIGAAVMRGSIRDQFRAIVGEMERRAAAQGEKPR